jgi:hypothetical protein
MAKYKVRLTLSPAEIDKEWAIDPKIGDVVVLKGREFEVIDTFLWGPDRVYIIKDLGLVFYGELIRDREVARRALALEKKAKEDQDQ